MSVSGWLFSDSTVTFDNSNYDFSSSYSLTTAAGSFAMTGEPAALNFASGATPYTLLANMGAFNLAGATETSNYQLDAANGYFSLTGENAALFEGAVPAYTLTAATGSFFLTGAGAALFPTGLPTIFGTDPLPIPRAASKDWQTQSREEQAKAIRIARRLDRSRRGIRERRKPKPPREREVIDTTNVPDELKDMALAMARQQIQMMPAPVTPPPRELTDAEKRLLKFVPIMRALK